MLNFKVREEPTLFTIGGKTESSSEYKNLIRDDTNKLLAVVGKNYKVIQNDELFNQITTRVEQALPGAKYHVKDKVARNGKVCFREFIFDEIKVQSLKDSKSDVHFRVITQNSFGHTGIKLYAGGIDFYCENGLILGHFEKTFKKHTKNLQLGVLNDPIQKGIDLFNARQAEWLEWQDRAVSRADAAKTLEDLAVGPRMSERLIARFDQESQDRGGTLWALYSALTFYASHNSAVFPVRQTPTDHTAETLLNRELQVQKWISSEPFTRLAA